MSHWLTREGIEKRSDLFIEAMATLMVVSIAVEFMKSEKIRRMTWQAILDARTCPYCRSMHGTEYDSGKYYPPCPAHLHCRCRYLEVMG